jgi:hypothetical protein
VRGGVTKFFGGSAALRPATPIARPVSTTPSPEFRRHFDVAPPAIDAREYRPAWRRETRLAGLVEAGRIGRETFVVACAWRQCAEAIGRVLVQRWTARTNGGILAGAGPTPTQITAATVLRNAGAALGDYCVRILHDHLVEDLSWRELGQRLPVDPKTAKVRTIAALEALAAWRAGRPIPPAPAERCGNQPSSW